MNRPNRLASVNAVVALDCPWCAEVVRVSEPELDAGFVCPGCLVRLEIHEQPRRRAADVELVAA
jgi:hypothetical protein